MDTYKKSLINRFCSAALACLLALHLIPLTLYAANTANPESFTIHVADTRGGVSQAAVAYEIKKDGTSVETGSATTDTEGYVCVSEMAGYADEAAGGQITISYSVSKAGYEANSAADVSVSDVKANIEVTLVESIPENADITVNKSGNGTVKISGTESSGETVAKGETLSLEITPVDVNGGKSYIKNLIIGAEHIPVEKYAVYTNGTYKVEENTAIVVDFATEYTLQSMKNEGGSVLLNHNDAESITLEEGSQVSINVIPDEGYQIADIAIDGMDETISDVEAFSKTISLNGNISVTVAFVKVYTLSIEYDSESGTVVTTPACAAGSVVVNTGTAIEVTATPNVNYRVQKVIKNNIPTEFTGNDKSYYDIVTGVDRDYSYKIIFAPNTYAVTKTEAVNGTVNLDKDVVDYNGNVNVTITPRDNNYKIGAIVIKTDSNTVGTVVDKENGDAYIEQEDGSAVYIIKGITENTVIDVTFEEIPLVGAEWTDKVKITPTTGSLKSSYTDRDGDYVFVYSNDAVLEMTALTPYNQTDCRLKDKTRYEGWKQTRIIRESCGIETLQVRTGRRGNAETIDLKGKKIIIVIDKTAPVITVTPDEPNSNGYYHDNVNLTVDVEDTDPSKPNGVSGIEAIEYWIRCDGAETKHQAISVEGDKTETYTANIQVAADENNSDDVKVMVAVTDISGNTRTEVKELRINKTVPSIKVEAAGTSKPESSDGYYATKQAVITVTDRTSTFDGNAVLDGITIAAKDAKGHDITVPKAAMLGNWTTIEGNTSDEATHTAVLTFDTDANYEWSIAYKNKADVSNAASALTATGDNVWKFTVDNAAPEAASIEAAAKTWSDLVSTLIFGVWTKHTVTPEAVAEDNISSISDIAYYKSDSDASLSGDELEALYEDNKFVPDKYSVSADEAFVVYARIMDKAGNTKYISTNGIIVDMTKSKIDLIPDAANKNGLYNSDVTIAVKVNEKVNADKAFSGIKKVDYTVECDGRVTQTGNLYTFDKENPARNQLKEEFEGTIKVEKEKNNSDNVIVRVFVEDNAGVTAEEKVKMSINTDRPEVKISFRDRANKVVDGNGYFGADRTAVIEITDRASAFDGEAALAGLKINAVDAKGNTVEVNPADLVSSWSHEGNIHRATAVFQKDGNYTWSFNYTNKADLKMKEAVTEGTTPFRFTVDKTDPTAVIKAGENIWDKLLRVLTFGLYSRNTVEISAKADDATSPVSIEYYKTSNPIAMDKDALDKITFAEFHGFSISDNEQFVVYLKVTDYSGNYIYINSDGYIVDKEASEIILTAGSANENGIYNKDVNIEVQVKDMEPYSGIQTVEYWIIKDGDTKHPTQSGNLYTFDVEKPAQNQLKSDWSGTITVDSTKNNSCDVVVYVKTVDNAGNESTKSVSLDIDTVQPEITVSYDNNKDNGGNGYFDGNRTAAVAIRERTHHFDAVSALDGITITAVDSKGKEVAVDKAGMVSSWHTMEGTTPDEAVHTATISYSTDANYTFAIHYTDKADNGNKTVNTADSQAPYKFTVDKAAPTGAITAATAEGRVTTWSELASRLTFGIWSNSKITIEGVYDDATSPIAEVEYYKTSDTTAKTEEELHTITDWKPFNGIDITSDEQSAVYLKIVDKAGNTGYISTDGMIVDKTAPREESIAPEITVSPQQPINDIYNGDVNVSIEVEDPLTGGTYSGLRTVSYRVLNQGTETQAGTLYSFEKDAPVREELRKKWTGEIKVNSEWNNSNDVVIEVYAEDNALNSSIGKTAIKIDITNPTINISYNSNTPDSGKYYKEGRVATIVVTERNFSAEDVAVTVTNTEGFVPVISGWSDTPGDGNQDNSTHTATIACEEDGDYTFAIEYTDLASNRCTGETYAAGTVNEKEFTVDRTAPEISVSYDNNDSQNSSYFKEYRTATVTVVEHNFDVSRVQFTQTASLNGAPTVSPVPVWGGNGDVHTATIAYNTDGDYTFDVTMQDMAGNEISGVNYNNSAASQEFTVDTSIAEPEIAGVENGKAYKGEVIPVITFSDINYSDYNVTLTRTRMAEKNADVTEEFIKTMNIGAQGGSGSNDTFEMEQKNDGIYTLTVRMKDMAGNESEKSVVFTLNRFGSVYEYSDYLGSLIENGGAYVQEVKNDFIVTEYNADKLVKDSLAIEITRDGRPVEDVKYDITPEMNDMAVVGGSGWFQYKYTISKDNFAEDGVYKMAISSKDVTGNAPENSNYKDKGILFRVDSTQPELTSVVGLEKGIVNAQKVDVKYTVYDTIGLKSVKIYVNDKMNGGEITDFAGDYNNYEGSFELKESDSAQKVRIVIEDMAGNITDSENSDRAYAFEKAVTVSTNALVRWYADKTLFFGSIGGLTAVIGAGAGLIFFRKRK